MTYCVRERIAPTRWNRAAPLDVEVTVMRVLWAVLAVAAVGCSSALPNAVASPSVSRVIEPTSTARTSASGTDEVSWTELAARPLQLPAVTAGARCPTSSTRPIPGTAPGAGGGPVYAVGTNPLPIDPRGAKVLFTAAPEYKAPALIRGRRLDGPEVIRFTSNGSAVWEELRFPTNTGVTSEHSELGWRDLPSDVFVTTPGCYAYQVDGVGFTTTIVFEAN